MCRGGLSWLSPALIPNMAPILHQWHSHSRSYCVAELLVSAQHAHYSIGMSINQHFVAQRLLPSGVVSRHAEMSEYVMRIVARSLTKQETQPQVVELLPLA